MLIVVAFVQLILHYLGWIGVLAGIVAFLFGNGRRGGELLIGGASFIVLKYILGIIFLPIMHLRRSRNPSALSKESCRPRASTTDDPQ